MNQGIKGVELYLSGWMAALAAFYLGGLDTGVWVPMVLAGVNVLAMLLILIGIHKFSDQHRYLKTAGTLAAFTFVVSLGTLGLQILATGGITDWMAALAICLVVSGDILFLGITGLVLLGLCALARLDGKEKEADRLAYLWALFLTLGVLYLAIQAIAVVLVNQSLAPLTYAVPIAGIPMVATGLWSVVRLYQIHPPKEK